MLLCDYGADVLKVERPSGGVDRDLPSRKVWERGKRSITLDLHDDTDRARLLELLHQADVFIDSFEPGTAPLGLEPVVVADAYPQLIHCPITGYGQEGPWAHRPGYDALVAARMGFMAEQPGHRRGPIFLGHPSISYTAAILASIGILAAVRARARTGLGQMVDASLLDGVLGQAPMNWW